MRFIQELYVTPQGSRWTEVLCLFDNPPTKPTTNIWNSVKCGGKVNVVEGKLSVCHRPWVQCGFNVLRSTKVSLNIAEHIARNDSKNIVYQSYKLKLYRILN